MDNTSYTIRVPKRWARMSLVVVVTALIVAPLSAVATHMGFVDVPDSNTHHNDIAWLKDADVTKGCNPPTNNMYCPSDFVTRAQMATFMRNLATNQVVDAGTVEGRSPGGIASFTGNRAVGANDVVSGVTKLEEIQVSAAEDGFLYVSGNSIWFSQNQATNVLVWLQIDNTTCNNSTASVRSVGFGYAATPGDVNRASMTIDGPVAVSEGNHTLTLCGNPFDGNLSPTLTAASIQAIFVGEGGIATGLASNSGATLPGTSG